MTDDTSPQILELTSDRSVPIQVEDLTYIEENQHVLEIEGHQSGHLKIVKVTEAWEDARYRQRGETEASFGFLSPDHLRAISIDREKFVQWISDYELPNDLVMPKNVGTYKCPRDPDSHIWTFEGVIKTCA
ncbi:hypothetical protein Tco_0123445 [Tanacetum coccineum]